MHDVRWNAFALQLFILTYQKHAPRPESRHTQQCSLKVSPVQTNYSPDGRALLYASAGHSIFFMTLGKEGEETKEQWNPSEKDPVRFPCNHYIFLTNRFHPDTWIDSYVQPRRRWSYINSPLRAYTTYNGLPKSHITRKPCCTCRRMCCRGLGSPGKVCETTRPIGISCSRYVLYRYLASGGYDSIVNMFDLSEWICARTITSCESVSIFFTPLARAYPRTETLGTV